MKSQIKKPIENQFGVIVAKINTLVTKPKIEELENILEKQKHIRKQS